jgi:CRP/FNR family cyclic AMP-dependent transcriptional regulator
MFGKGHHDVPSDRLRALPMFAEFSDAELCAIDNLMCPATIGPGSSMMAQGKPGRQAFIVIAGEAAVYVDGEVVASVGPGDVVGEMALMSNQPRSASVVAISSLEVFAIDPREFATLFGDPRLARWFKDRLTQRVRQREYTNHLLTIPG